LLIADGIKYSLHVPKDEGEFERLAKEHLSEIFGVDVLYFDIKPELRSKAGIGSKPDGIAIVFDEPCAYIVEFELSKHPIHDHIVAQISKFNAAIKNTDTRLKIAEAIHNEIRGDAYKKFLAESKTKIELFKFLTELLSSKLKLCIIIDDVTEKLKESLESLPFETRVVDFKTFERDEVGLAVHAHLFEPLKVKRKPKRPKPPRPEHNTSWEKRLEWVDEETRNLAKEVIKAIEGRFPDVQHSPRYRWYYFYKGSKRSLDSLFAVLMLTKKTVKVRIKAEPSTFQDERNWTKPMKGWFFPRKLQERELIITERQQIPYALELITQSYNISALHQ
jgi:predicted transport protein